MLTAVVGINWGDEGKGRMVDLFARDYDVIVRYQGGNNAGHTIINDFGKFVLNLLPSGVIHKGTVNVLGAGMVIDIQHLSNEIASLNEKLKPLGKGVTPENVKVSDKATVVLPYHILQDVLEEERLKDKKFGSTRRGIAPAYSDKFLKKALRISDLQDKETLKEKVESLVEWKNLTLKGYKKKVCAKETLAWLNTYADNILPYVTDTTHFLEKAMADKKRILFEGQLGALRDIEYGIYPYTTSSTTLAAYAPTGAGVPFARLDKVIGVMKAFSTCVGEGPFVVEMSGDEATKLREAGGEYGAATGRPRRVGAFDVVASRYGIKVQGATEIALTKLDILSYMDKIPVCVAYEVDGKRIDYFPTGDKLARAKPIYEYLPGFKKDISKCRCVSDLPKEALDYIMFLQKATNSKIKYVSVGPDRADYFLLGGDA
ncbi:MAG: adenylosuccinate synthase [Firmicutes bacterium]|nr:adenylosuccinate synthase [Bacillota bacterium]